MYTCLHVGRYVRMYAHDKTPRTVFSFLFSFCSPVRALKERVANPFPKRAHVNKKGPIRVV